MAPQFMAAAYRNARLGAIPAACFSTLSRRPVACSTEENHMLDITTLAAWGEFIGGIAVVVSLIYLARQIQQNSRLLRASTAGATAQIEFSSNALLVQDAEVARIFWDGVADRNALSEAVRQWFDALLTGP
jgi:hypothetical protein